MHAQRKCDMCHFENDYPRRENGVHEQLAVSYVPACHGAKKIISFETCMSHLYVGDMTLCYFLFLFLVLA